jgi:hypothetical protein
VGTGSALGTTAVEAAAVVDTVAALGGEAALCARVSTADPRGRHQGVSHHTATVLRLARTSPVVPLPPELADAAVLAVDGVVAVDAPDVRKVLESLDLPVVTSMGRGPAEDPAFFGAAGAAGAWLARQYGGG